MGRDTIGVLMGRYILLDLHVPVYVNTYVHIFPYNVKLWDLPQKLGVNGAIWFGKAIIFGTIFFYMISRNGDII